MRKDNAQERAGQATRGRGVLRVRRGPAGAVRAAIAAARQALRPRYEKPCGRPVLYLRPKSYPVLLHDQVVGQAAGLAEAIHVLAARGHISNSAPALEPGKDGGLRWC